MKKYILIASISSTTVLAVSSLYSFVAPKLKDKLMHLIGSSIDLRLVQA